MYPRSFPSRKCREGAPELSSWACQESCPKGLRVRNTSYKNPTDRCLLGGMKRALIFVVAGLVVVVVLGFIVWAGKSGRPSAARQTEPAWKVVVTLPKTNDNASSSNALPKKN